MRTDGQTLRGVARVVLRGGWQRSRTRWRREPPGAPITWPSGVPGASGGAPTFAPRVPIRRPDGQSERRPFAAPKTEAPGRAQTAASARVVRRAPALPGLFLSVQ